MRETIRNVDRAVGVTLAGEIARLTGDRGVPDAPVRLEMTGSAGQSFGAFALPGMHLQLTGDANDGVGKGMHGGTIVISAPDPNRVDQVLVGNAALYGATGGRLLVAGLAGERFGVRNSGAWAVVEGVGHHGCEYMTGGVVVVLGPTGRNFAAGMTGGVAYVYDPAGTLDTRVNTELVEAAALVDEDGAKLRQLISEHRVATGSRVASALLAGWRESSTKFRRVSPKPAPLVPVVATATRRLKSVQV